jgi:GNAT superfamily N-acetyltransferase
MKLMPFQIYQGLQPAQLQRAAQLYFETFRRQISPLLGSDSRAVAFLRQAINPQNALAAHREGEIIGLTGLHYANQPFLQLQLPLFIRHFGGMVGRVRFHQAALFQQTLQAGHLLIDSVVVDPAMRGRGVGTWLINAAVDFAHQRGFEAVHIHVPDTAPALLHLCRRLGFVQTATQLKPSLRPFGITEFVSLTKTV